MQTSKAASPGGFCFCKHLAGGKCYFCELILV